MGSLYFMLDEMLKHMHLLDSQQRNGPTVLLMAICHLHPSSKKIQFGYRVSFSLHLLEL